MNYIDEFKNIKSLCRVCLTQSKNMIPLNTNLEGTEKDSFGEKDVSIIEALEEVVGRKINWSKEYSNIICPMCLGLLKISYSFKVQFKNSEILLLKHFQTTSDPLLYDNNHTDEINSKDTEPSPVQIIVGSNKYDLKDVLIIEEEKSDHTNFKGFLNNLGSSITAKFVRKSKKKSKTLQEEKPIVLIEKQESQTKKYKTKEVNFYPKCFDQYVKVDDNLYTQEPDRNMCKENVEFKKLALRDISTADRELFQNALNIRLKCSVCNKLYSSKVRFRRHLESCKKLLDNLIKDKTGKIVPLALRCHICLRIFKEKKFLNYHIKTVHLDPSKYKCDICGQILRNRNVLVYHKLAKHAGRDFVCDICDKKFVTSNSLKAHLLRHSQKNEAQCVCPVCGKIFYYRGALFYHMKLHNNERKYCCEYCDKKFYNLNAKKRHTRTHTGIRPYACKYCEKCFFSSGELRKHEYLHTGVRPYSCQYCKKGFTSSYNMKVHLVSHPGPYPCKLCNKTFISMDVLQYHHKTKHSDIDSQAINDNLFVQPN